MTGHGVATNGAYVGRFFTVSGGTHRSSATARADAEHEVEVTDVREVATDVAAISLRGVTGPLPSWGAGAHLDLVLPDGRTTQYSLCSDPGDRSVYRIGVLRAGDHPEAVSRSVHLLRSGQRLTIRGPRNQFALARAPRYVFIAGGIGITPILSMVRGAVASGSPWHLFYLGRARGSMAFLDELKQYGDHVTVWAKDERTGRVGIATMLEEAHDDGLVYCCGPQSLIEAVEEEGATRAPGRVRTERFVSSPVERPDDQPFEVRCELSDTTLTVPPGTSVLEQARNRGIATVSSCNKGICGTCETVVLDGTPDHRDAVLDEEDRAAGDTMMICVSRAVGGRLVLDL